MGVLGNLITGGFLKGYRTKVLAFALLLNVVASYLVGDVGLIQAIQENWEQIAIAFGLLTAAVHTS